MLALGAVPSPALCHQICPWSPMPGQRRPGLRSPGQTWSSQANFRNDLSTQLLLSHWSRGRAGEGPGGAVGEGAVCESLGRGARDICPSPPLGRLAGVPALPPGETSWAGAVPVTGGLAWTRYRQPGFYGGHLRGRSAGLRFPERVPGGCGGRPRDRRSLLGLSGVDNVLGLSCPSLSQKTRGPCGRF